MSELKLKKLDGPMLGPYNNAIYTHVLVTRTKGKIYFGQMDYPGNISGPCQISDSGLINLQRRAGKKGSY